MEKEITPNYETISTMEMGKVMALCNSSVSRAFSHQDYVDLIEIFQRVVSRLLAQEENDER